MDDAAIGLVEFNSIAMGVLSLDAMMKRAAVKLIDAFPVCPGKYIILVCGEVGAVRTAVSAAVKAVGEDAIVSRIVIPNAHEHVGEAIW